MQHETKRMALSMKLMSALFCLAVMLPIVERLTHLIPSESLYNVAKEGRLKRPTRGGFTSGKFQSHFERWFLHNCGLWELLVKAQNTLNYHLFNIVSSRYGGETLMGAYKALHDRVYLMDMNGLAYGRRRKTVTPDPQKQVDQLKKLQDFFVSKGKVFLVVLHPTKPLVHPEWVSENQMIHSPNPRYFPKFEAALKSAGVTYVHLQPPANEKEFPLFSKSGAHMTSYGKCLSAQGVVDAIIASRGDVMSRIQCVLDNTLVPAYGEDLDLLRLLNAWETEQSTSMVPGFALKKNTPQLKSHTKLLAIGTSYVFGLIKAFEEADSFSDTNFIFYKKSRYYGKNLGTDQQRKGAKKYLASHHDISFALSHDVIILEATEAKATQIGFGFLEDVIRQINLGVDKMPE